MRIIKCYDVVFIGFEFKGTVENVNLSLTAEISLWAITIESLAGWAGRRGNHVRFAQLLDAFESGRGPVVILLGRDGGLGVRSAKETRVGANLCVLGGALGGVHGHRVRLDGHAWLRGCTYFILTMIDFIF